MERILASFLKHWLLLEKAPTPLFGRLVRCSTHGRSFSKLIEWGFSFRCVCLAYSFRLLIGCYVVTIGKISTLPAQAMKTATEKLGRSRAGSSVGVSKNCWYMRLCTACTGRAATIRGWCLFCSELPNVGLLFEGGDFLGKCGI